MKKHVPPIQGVSAEAERIADGALPTEVLLFPALERVARAGATFDVVIGYKGVMYRVIIADIRQLSHGPLTADSTFLTNT